MTFPKFELRDMLTCAATEDEGFRCVRSPNHGGAHEWGRCAHVDAAGHRCYMPPGHPNGHVLPWFDSPAHDGDRHTVRYQGSEDECQRHTLRDMPVFARHGWVSCDTTFATSWPWRWGPTAWLLSRLVGPRGRLEVIYEFRPREAESPAND
jgi:hypothetical protein